MRALYHDVRCDCGLFDNVHLRATAPQPGEMCAHRLLPSSTVSRAWGM